MLPSSPADVADLLPYGDYILGTPSGIVRGEAGLGELVEDHLGRPLKLYVYNHEFDVSRLVTITPSRGWGGSGALGCVLGFGALHRLPKPLAEGPVEGPGETMFESGGTIKGEQYNGWNEQDEASQVEKPQILVQPTAPLPPINPGQSAQVATSTTPSHHRHKHRHHHKGTSPNRVAFEEYFKEGEQRSKEEDFVPSTSTLPPPPPKLSGPSAPPPETTYTGSEEAQEEEGLLHS